MEFNTQKFISNFVESQFPQFYQEDGPGFILFVKAYYEWLEESGNPIYEARTLLDYRDIDNTIEKFLEYFQKKYLYGIPFNVIVNKRLLLKHVLDVYRSKSSIQGYKLLFRLLYNEDIEIYLPGRDILRASDGIWKEPRYLEITYVDDITTYQGKVIVGVTSRVSAIVESVVRESFDTNQINILYLSNISPRGGSFEIGEKIVCYDCINDQDEISRAPSILGSLDSLQIINGGQDFELGDAIKIAHTDVSNGSIISYGIDGILKVTGLSRGLGSLFFSINNPGFGYTANASIFLYKNDLTGNGASFELGSLSSVQNIQYNTDVICDQANLAINATTYLFSANAAANLSSTIGSAFKFTNANFGSISTLTNIRTGNGYTQAANVFVRSCLLSNTLQGTISYNTTSNTITGTSTLFNTIFSNDDVIVLQSNSSLSNTRELALIKEVSNSTQIILYGPPKSNSTASATYRAAPTILPANFPLYDPVMVRADGTVNGENEKIDAIPSSGNNVVANVAVISSGKNYKEGEKVFAYLYGAVSNNISIVDGGVGYTNNDPVLFVGGTYGKLANGYVLTNSNGVITNVTLSYAGSGYKEVPVVRVQSNTGSGAVLSVTLAELNIASEVQGTVTKRGIGKGIGFWTTTRGFLNSDKYIQDSYYYQDYSYEIRVAEVLSKYKDILYNTFHTSGTELFGKFLLINKESSNVSILSENTTANTSLISYYMASIDTVTSDSSLTIDRVT